MSRRYFVTMTVPSDRATLREHSARYARQVLVDCGGNKRLAAHVLGISYHTLRKYVAMPMPIGAGEEPTDVA